jgi:PKD repeat protein
LIQYNAYGVYSVTLTATNEFGNSTITKTDYISVGVDGIINLPSVVAVYPNPTNGKLFITNPSDQTLEITVFNTIGKQVNSTTSDESVISMDITGQSKGVYIVKITNKMKQNVKVQKVVLK